MAAFLGIAIAALILGDAAASSSALIFSCAAGAHRLEIDNSTSPLGYTVFVSDEEWLTGGAIRVHAANAWFSTDAAPGGIVLRDYDVGSGVDPRLGPFSALSASWNIPAAGGLQIQSYFRCFTDNGGSVMFTIEFPDGLEGLALSPFPPEQPLAHYNSSVAPAALFPAFLSDSKTTLGSSLGFLEWLGNWAATENHVGHGLAASTDRFVGGQASGPLVLFNSSTPEGGPALVLAPAAHFKTAITGVVNSSNNGGRYPGVPALGVGPHGYTPSLPPGFSLDVIMASSQLGIGDAVARWGASSQAWSNTTRLSPTVDVVSSYLSYFTDNVRRPCFSKLYVSAHPVGHRSFRVFHRAPSIATSTGRCIPRRQQTQSW